jgi:hypothetical protein
MRYIGMVFMSCATWLEVQFQVLRGQISGLDIIKKVRDNMGIYIF